MLRVFFLLFEAAEHIQEETASDPLWCHPCGPSLPLCLGSWASRQQVSPHLPLVQSNHVWTFGTDAQFPSFSSVRCEAAGWSLDCSSKEMCFKLYCWHAVFCPTSFGQGNTPVGMWHWNELGSINLDPKQDLGRKLYFFFQCLLRADLNGSIWSHFTWRGIFQKCVNEKRKMCTVSCSVWVTVQITVYLRVKYLTIALVFF